MNEIVQIDVMFRQDKEGNSLAVFPYDIADMKGNCGCYAHIGQHSGCCWKYVMNYTKPATEFSELQRELESIGYKLNVIRRRNYNRWTEAYLKVLKR
jgi:hypothetical protein